jgi:YgiT-type zinc finger domain-containing protein
MKLGVRCYGCGEDCEPRTITIALPRAKTGIAVFRNVPADVCTRCGEPRFSLHTASRLMAVVRDNVPPDEVTQVPVYDLNP